MKKTKVVFFDIDHTLYDPIKKEVPKSTIEAIKALSTNPEVVIAIATGRASYMLHVIESIKQYVDLYITINGQVIYTKDTILHDQPLTKEIIQTIREVFENYNLIYGCIGEDTQVINRLDDTCKHMFDEVSMPRPIINKAYFEDHHVYQMWAFADQITASKVSTSLKKYRLVPWLSDGFDIVLFDQTKKEGIEIALKALNIPLENAYAFGDGENDIEMLKYVPNSIAMGNSVPHAKAHAKHVTTSYDNDGILNGLKYFNLI